MTRSGRGEGDPGAVDASSVATVERDLVAELADLPVVHRAGIMRKLSVGQRNELRDRWRHWAHEGGFS